MENNLSVMEIKGKILKITESMILTTRLSINIEDRKMINITIIG